MEKDLRTRIDIRRMAAVMVALCLSGPLPSDAAPRAVVTEFAKVGAWSLAHASVVDLYGCSARIKLPDDTAWIDSVQAGWNHETAPVTSLMAVDFTINCLLIRQGRPRYPLPVHRAADFAT